MYLISETVVLGIPASETVVFNSISSKPVVVTSLSFSSFYSFNFSSFLFTQNATPKITIFSYYYHRECFVLLYTCIQIVTLPWESAQFYHWINLTYIFFPRISLHTHWKIILQMPFFCFLRFTCLLSSSQFPRLLVFPFPFKYFLMFLSKFFYADADSYYVCIPYVLEIMYDVTKSSGGRILFFRGFWNAVDIKNVGKKTHNGDRTLLKFL